MKSWMLGMAVMILGSPGPVSGQPQASDAQEAVQKARLASAVDHIFDAFDFNTLRWVDGCPVVVARIDNPQFLLMTCPMGVDRSYRNTPLRDSQLKSKGFEVRKVDERYVLVDTWLLEKLSSVSPSPKTLDRAIVSLYEYEPGKWHDRLTESFRAMVNTVPKRIAARNRRQRFEQARRRIESRMRQIQTPIP